MVAKPLFCALFLAVIATAFGLMSRPFDLPLRLRDDPWRAKGVAGFYLGLLGSVILVAVGVIRWIA